VQKHEVWIIELSRDGGVTWEPNLQIGAKKRAISAVRLATRMTARHKELPETNRYHGWLYRPMLYGPRPEEVR